MLKNNPNHDTLQFLGSWKTSILSPKKQTFSPFLFERRELKQLYWILFSTCGPMFPWSDLVRSLHQMDITLTPESKRSKNFKFMWEFIYLFIFFSNSREFSFVGRKEFQKVMKLDYDETVLILSLRSYWLKVTIWCEEF